MAYDAAGLFRIIAREVECNPGITLSALADRLGVHRHTASTAVKIETGRTFREWSRRCAIDKAAVILRVEPNATVTEVAARVGFSNLTAFDRSFRRILMCSPSFWRTGRAG